MEIVKEIFRNEFPIKYSYGFVKKYVYEIDKMLKNIYNQIKSDIKQGEGEHYYIQDKNRKSLDRLWNWNSYWRHGTWFSWRYCRGSRWRRICKLGI